VPKTLSMRHNQAVDWYEEEVAQLEKTIAERHLASPVVFYGSSSIRLWTTLSVDMKRDDVLNLGFGGSTLEACVYFYDRLACAARPRSLVLYAGDNDLGDGKCPEQVLAYCLPGVPYTFISIKPSPARAAITDCIYAANSEILAEIAKRPEADFIDVFTSMLDRNAKPRPELYQEDGLHLNRAGYDLWTKIVLEHRGRIF
jgi:hypothetical protein